jgi:HEAT repeat protein
MLNRAARKLVVAAPWVAMILWLSSFHSASAQSIETLNPTQREIYRQQQRLSSASDEERRDALMSLGAMHVAEASRAALPGLSDPSVKVRAIAAKAILWLSPSESVPALIPLLSDKDEFVRREASYSLGLTGSKAATAPLIERLLNDKEDGVRGAAAVALGQIGDETSVIPLANVLSGQSKRKGKQEQNEFVLRATAEALGRIKSRAAVPALIAVVTNEKLSSDVRREAVRALGSIGDPSAAAALNQVAVSNDPYLSHAAYQSLKQLSNQR